MGRGALLPTGGGEGAACFFSFFFTPDGANVVLKFVRYRSLLSLSASLAVFVVDAPPPPLPSSSLNSTLIRATLLSNPLPRLPPPHSPACTPSTSAAESSPPAPPPPRPLPACCRPPLQSHRSQAAAPRPPAPRRRGTPAGRAAAHLLGPGRRRAAGSAMRRGRGAPLIACGGGTCHIVSYASQSESIRVHWTPFKSAYAVCHSDGPSRLG